MCPGQVFNLSDMHASESGNVIYMLWSKLCIDVFGCCFLENNSPEGCVKVTSDV